VTTSGQPTNSATQGPDRLSATSELWDRFKASADANAREALILYFSPLVKFVAGRMAMNLPRSVDPSDLVSYGIFGLIDAIDKFEPERGFKFETYAINRIKGAILDELRALDWVPRSVRSRAREIERSLAELEHRFQRTPSDEELAAHMGVEVENLRTNLAEIFSSGMVALDDLVGPEGGASMGELMPDPLGVGPEAAFQLEETRRVLSDAINRLPDRERLVITLYYFEGLTLAEIGDVLGVTESRVCQIHAKSVMSLRNRMSEPTFH
jgi:RNA polymerase sigma factor for flagellar operon FliA